VRLRFLVKSLVTVVVERLSPISSECLPILVEGGLKLNLFEILKGQSELFHYNRIFMVC
jgi:hypothetical protein